MKVLVIGAQGMLGQDLVPVLAAAGHLVVPADVRSAAGAVTLDMTDRAALAAVLDAERPDAIALLAAYTNVDGAETDEATAYRLNALGPWNVSLEAQARDLRVLYMSTDYVFDGTQGSAYDEYDATHPQSVYGRSKRSGELHVERLVPRHYIARTSWLYGVHGKNFVETMLAAGATRPELRVVNDQWGCPTWTVDLCHTLVRLLESDRYGTYHVTGQGPTTWFDFAREILRLGGLSTPVLPQTTTELNRPAPRPAYSVLRARALELGGFPAMPAWQDSLAQYMAARSASVH